MTKSQLRPSSARRRTASAPAGRPATSGHTPLSASTRPTRARYAASSSPVDTYQPVPAPNACRVTAGRPASGPAAYEVTASAPSVRRSSLQRVPAEPSERASEAPAASGRNSSPLMPSTSRSAPG